MGFNSEFKGLNPLLLGQAISVLVFLLVLMSMVPIQLLFLTILVVCILMTCAAHRNLCDFINLIRGGGKC